MKKQAQKSFVAITCSTFQKDGSLIQGYLGKRSDATDKYSFKSHDYVMSHGWEVVVSVPADDLEAVETVIQTVDFLMRCQGEQSLNSGRECPERMYDPETGEYVELTDLQQHLWEEVADRNGRAYYFAREIQVSVEWGETLHKGQWERRQLTWMQDDEE